MRHDFCLSVIAGFVQNSFDNSLSISAFSVQCWPRLVVAVTISNCNLSSPRTIKMLKVKFKECVHCAE